MSNLSLQTLTGPGNWSQWEPEFRRVAVAENLWSVICGLEAPIKPNLNDYALVPATTCKGIIEIEVDVREFTREGATDRPTIVKKKCKLNYQQRVELLISELDRYHKFMPKKDQAMALFKHSVSPSILQRTSRFDYPYQAWDYLNKWYEQSPERKSQLAKLESFGQVMQWFEVVLEKARYDLVDAKGGILAKPEGAYNGGFLLTEMTESLIPAYNAFVTHLNFCAAHYFTDDATAFTQIMAEEFPDASRMIEWTFLGNFELSILDLQDAVWDGHRDFNEAMGTSSDAVEVPKLIKSLTPAFNRFNKYYRAYLFGDFVDDAPCPSTKKANYRRDSLYSETLATPTPTTANEELLTWEEWPETNDDAATEQASQSHDTANGSDNSACFDCSNPMFQEMLAIMDTFVLSNGKAAASPGENNASNATATHSGSRVSGPGDRSGGGGQISKAVFDAVVVAGKRREVLTGVDAGDHGALDGDGQVVEEMLD